MLDDPLEQLGALSDHLPLVATVRLPEAGRTGPVTVDEPLLVKVRKLLAKAEATQNPHEADAFAAKAAALIAAHRIDTARLAAAGRTEALTHPLADDRARRLRAGPAGAARGRRRQPRLRAGVGVEHRRARSPSSPASRRTSTPPSCSTSRCTCKRRRGWRRCAGRRRRRRSAGGGRSSSGTRPACDEILGEARRDVEAHTPDRRGTTLPDLPGRAAQVSEFAEDGVRAGRAGVGARGRGGRRVGARPPRGVGSRRRAGAAGGAAAAGSRVSADDVGRAATYAAEEDAFGGTDLDVETSLEALVALAATVTAGGVVAGVRRAGGARRGGDRPTAPLVVGAPGGTGRRRATGGRPAHAGHAHPRAGPRPRRRGGRPRRPVPGRPRRRRGAASPAPAAAADLARRLRHRRPAVGDRRWPSPVRATGTGSSIVP